ncbi:winged helix-turn-helix domain-containing protein, partial [Pantoea endophytica]
MSSDVKPDSILTFDLEEGVLSSGENEVRLNRQGIRCFELLTKHPDVVISKDEFIEQCWKKYGYLVTDNSVRQTFFQLRRALDEIGAPPDTLITIPKKGYKLSPDVSFVILNADARSGTEDQAQNKIQEQQDQSVEPL